MTSTLKKSKPSFANPQLIDIMHRMTSCSDIEDLLEQLFENTKELVCRHNKCYGFVAKLDRSSGKIKVVVGDKVSSREEISYDYSTSAKALNEGIVYNTPIIEKDSLCKRHWSNTCSQIVIPIKVNKARVIRNLPSFTEKVRCNIKMSSEEQKSTESLTEIFDFAKPIGILVFESENESEFNQDLEDTLMLLCSYAGEIIEKINRASTLESFHEIEEFVRTQETKQNTPTYYNSIINKLVHKTCEKLSFSIVHISLVDSNRKKIISKYAYGPNYTESEIEYLHDKANFELSESDDIQTWIVKHGKTEVPEIDDPRFDSDLRQKLKHYNFIRIYIPIISPSNGSVIGTLEAGYYHGFNKYIYESDRYLLMRVIDLILNTMERQKAILINKVIHDLRSPVSSIRSNSDYLVRRIYSLDNKLVQKKAQDVFNDCESLRHTIAQLEYALTNKLTRIPRPRNVNIYTEIIVKSVEEHKEFLQSKGFVVKYFVNKDMESICSEIDIAKVMNVVHNLFDNAVKYRDKLNRDSWEISILMTNGIRKINNKEVVDIYFQDRGIGIKDDHKDLIFNLGFRDPDVVRWVNGSGLGLSIAKDLMNEIGGDLQLTKHKDPTTFKLSIPIT